MVRLPVTVLILSACSCFHLLAAAEMARFPADQIQFFENRIRPVLQNKCSGCHNDKLPTSGLSTDSREGILRGGNRGEAAAEGLPEESRLVHAIQRQGDLKMPPGEPLADQEISALVRWIRMGLPWPDPAPDREKALEDPSKHWAFQPIRRPAEPVASDPGWVRNPVTRSGERDLDPPGLPGLDRTVAAPRGG